jgi:hypothetical protein
MFCHSFHKLCLNSVAFSSGCKGLTFRFLSSRQNVAKSIDTAFEEIASKDETLLKIITVTKKNMSQSPLRMKFLVRLVRDTWLPDALAQMKFSPKHRAVDIGQMLNVSSFQLRF